MIVSPEEQVDWFHEQMRLRSWLEKPLLAHTNLSELVAEIRYHDGHCVACQIDENLRIYGFGDTKSHARYIIENGWYVGWPERYEHLNPFNKKVDNSIYMQAVYEIVGRGRS